MARWMVGIDTGGTFTDLIAVEESSGEIRLAKVPSLPQDPSAAVIEALEDLFRTGVSPAEVGMLVHGTTVATNAMLEGKGVRTGLLITQGFRAVYETRGWTRPSQIDLISTAIQKPPLLAPQGLTEEIPERVDHAGAVVVPLDEVATRAAAERLREKGVESVAICFLFSFLNTQHEERSAAIVSEVMPNCRVSLSSRVLPVIREYPRLSTTVIDAYVGPIVERYLLRLADKFAARGVTTPQLFLMQSNGGLMRLAAGARFPNQTLMSGLAAGAIAGSYLSRLCSEDHVLSFDMGGTSTDISVIVEGRVRETSDGRIAGQDLGTPMLNVRTLGAGGGTLAWIGKDGRLKVGPQSAGADPGPACYGRGGNRPTVTDANLVLGALGEDQLLAGRLRPDRRASREAIRQHIAEPLGLTVEDAAAGIVRIVNTVMSVDLRRALQDEGQDPRRFALVASGGAGPLHAAALARMLGIPRVLVPPHPGINCAMGLLQTEVRHSYIQSAVGLLPSFPVERFNALLRQLEVRALDDAAQEGFDANSVRLVRQVDLRYLHQGYQITVPCPSRDFAEADKLTLKRMFDDHHRRIYGQSAENEDAEVVSFRVLSEVEVPRLELKPIVCQTGAAAASEREFYDPKAKRWARARLYDRTRLAPGDRLEGPAIILQFDSTTLILGGQSAEVNVHGIIIIDSGARDDA